MWSIAREYGVDEKIIQRPLMEEIEQAMNEVVL